MEIAKPFIQLPYSFDASRMAVEVDALGEDAWMRHPNRMPGNSAVALLSRQGGDNDDFDGAMIETPHLQRCPCVRQVMASFGEVLGRSRLMKLAAGSEVSLHVDFNYHWYTRVRIHVPIITNPEVIFFCADEHIHMRAGECWIFNSWRRHRVTNGGDEDRVHLVIDTAGSSRFWNTVNKMAALDREADKDAIEQLVTDVPYHEDRDAGIRAERYNIAPVMSPGELDALVRDLVADFEQAGENDPELVTQYKFLLSDFASDWRELWLLYGYQKDGWPHYEALIAKVSGQLHPDRTALITSTNKIGVNPIIMQRILRSAIATEHFDQFVG